jgi:hypothetical protein
LYYTTADGGDDDDDDDDDDDGNDDDCDGNDDNSHTKTSRSLTLQYNKKARQNKSDKRRCSTKQHYSRNKSGFGLRQQTVS